MWWWQAERICLEQKCNDAEKRGGPASGLRRPSDPQTGRKLPSALISNPRSRTPVMPTDQISAPMLWHAFDTLFGLLKVRCGRPRRFDPGVHMAAFSEPVTLMRHGEGLLTTLLRPCKWV